MPVRTTAWPPGTPCWIDYGAADIESATAFYAGVLDWTYIGGEPEYGGYLTCQATGHAAAGMAPQQDPTDPPRWTTYFATDDIDASAARITENAGTVLVPPMDVGPRGGWQSRSTRRAIRSACGRRVSTPGSRSTTSPTRWSGPRPRSRIRRLARRIITRRSSVFGSTPLKAWTATPPSPSGISRSAVSATTNPAVPKVGRPASRWRRPTRRSRRSSRGMAR
jgi:predicted enzyme related to lactoylglutathione lyase